MSNTYGENLKLNDLVVDDEHVVADSLAWILNLTGFNACSVYSGRDAINHVVVNPIDILVSDVVMDGVSGSEAAIEICKVLPHCKVLLMSGNILTADMLKDAHEQGHDFDILAKPVHPSVIIDRLHAMTS